MLVGILEVEKVVGEGLCEFLLAFAGLNQPIHSHCWSSVVQGVQFVCGVNSQQGQGVLVKSLDVLQINLDHLFDLSMAGVKEMVLFKPGHYCEVPVVEGFHIGLAGNFKGDLGVGFPPS